MPSNHLIFCCPLLLLSSIFPSIRVFSSDLPLHIRWPKYWSFSFSNSPTNEYSGLVSFRIDWFDLPAVQGILKSLLQHHSLKASVFHSAFHSAFFVFTVLKVVGPTTWAFHYNLAQLPTSAPFCLRVSSGHQSLLCLGHMARWSPEGPRKNPQAVYN